MRMVLLCLSLVSALLGCREESEVAPSRPSPETLAAANRPRPETPPVAGRPSPESLYDSRYFENRGALEPKHMAEAQQWKNFFNPKTALDAGCGMGQRVYTLGLVGVDAEGFDISPVAIEKSPFKQMLGKKLFVGDITQKVSKKQYDLVIVYDVFEHLQYETLQAGMDNVFSNVAPGGHVVVSVPVLGDPNLTADPTHVIKESKQWWIDKLSGTGFKVQRTPDHFLFKDQMIIGLKPGPSRPRKR